MISYKQRSEQATNPALKKLFQIMDEKQTNLCVSADVTKQQELLDLADLNHFSSIIIEGDQQRISSTLARIHPWHTSRL